MTSTSSSSRKPNAPSTLSRTIEGFEFDTADSIWRVPTAHATAVFNFRKLPGVTDELRENFKDAFAALLLANAPERLSRLLSRLRGILRFLYTTNPHQKIDEFTAAHLHNYGSSLPKHQQYFLRQAREILLAWAPTGVPGLSDDLLLFLPPMETSHHEVGRAVRMMDPKSGPLNDMEFEATVAAARNSFATGKMSLADYALIVLAISLGARTMQLAMLKTKDLSISQRDDLSKVHILQVTRLKQGKNIRPRTIFKPRQLTPSIGELLEQQIAAAHVWALRNGIAPQEAPLFPTTTVGLQQRRLVLPELKGHCASANMCLRISRILTRLKVKSTSTGKPMRLFQTRMRRTLGTRAAAEGHSVSVIADLLDHSWVDSSLVYIETRPEIIERIDKALALQIAPLAQAFAGTLVRQTQEQSVKTKGKIIHIATPEKIEPLGSCGKFDFCGLAAPLACYTCAYFNPWLDSVHETLLDDLIAQRDDFLANADLRIASVNDRTILAVADVVNRCRTVHGEVG